MYALLLSLAIHQEARLERYHKEDTQAAIDRQIGKRYLLANLDMIANKGALTRYFAQGRLIWCGTEVIMTADMQAVIGRIVKPIPTGTYEMQMEATVLPGSVPKHYLLGQARLTKIVLHGVGKRPQTLWEAVPSVARKELVPSVARKELKTELEWVPYHILMGKELQRKK